MLNHWAGEQESLVCRVCCLFSTGFHSPVCNMPQFITLFWQLPTVNSLARLTSRLVAWSVLLAVGFSSFVTTADDLPPHQQVDQLLQSGQLNAAADLAAEQIASVPADSVEAADWAVLVSTLRLELLLRAPIAEEPQRLATVIQPVDALLTRYPRHPSAAWLRFQRLAVDSAVAQRQATVVLASPGDESRRIRTLATMIRTAGQLRDLQAEVVDLIALAFQQRKPDAAIDRLIALRNTIAIERVGLLLLRGDLFPLASNDQLASASEADRAALDALAMIRDNPKLTADLIRLRCEALVRMGQTGEASFLLTNLLLSEADAAAAAKGADSSTSESPGQASGDASAGNPSGSNPQVISDATLAVIIKIRLAQQNPAEAEQWLSQRYGESPADVVAPVDLDLARLRWLLHTRNDQSSDWIEAIRVRGGEFAYRRALAIAIEMLGPEAARLGNSALVIAESAQMLRSGNATAAAQTLAIAAADAADATAARELSIAAAAALVHTGQFRQAAELLHTTATKFDQSTTAAELQLQAAVILERQPEKTADDATCIDQWLQELLQRWPQQPPVGPARQWLADRIAQRGQAVQAAIAATPQSGSAATEADWDHALQRWIAALVPIDWLDDDHQPSEPFVQAAVAAIQSVGQPSTPGGRRCYSVLISLLGNQQAISNDAALEEGLPTDAADSADPSSADPSSGAPTSGDLESESSDDAADQQQRRHDDQLVRWLIAARKNLIDVQPPAQPQAATPQLRQLAARRLIADALGNSHARPAVAAAILPLTEDLQTLDTCYGQALIWSERFSHAAEALELWAAGQHTQQQHRQARLQAARMLADSDSADAKRLALGQLTALADQLTPGEPLWHRTKLATAQTMSRLGQTQEAKQLAGYLLITRPPTDPAVLRALEQLAR